MPETTMQKPSLAERLPETGIMLKWVQEENKDIYFAELRCGDRALKLTDIVALNKPTLEDIVRHNLSDYDMWAHKLERSFPRWAKCYMSAEKIDIDEIENLYAGFEAQSIRCREIETFYGEHFSTLLYDTDWIEA